MTSPTRTPNPATSTRPERSSRRVAHQKPLGWLPWAVLALLAGLLALVLLAINAVDDDGPEGPAGDSLGQIGSGGSGIDGQDGDGRIAGTEGDAAPGSQPSSGSQPTSGAQAPTGTGAGALSGALAGLGTSALVGGGGTSAAAAAGTESVLTGTREAGTAGTVLFAEGSAELDADARQVVSTAASSLRDARARSVEVLGYTDVVAGAPVNAPLSQQRADAVAAALRTELPGVQVTTAARGQEDPIASNDTDEGRQQNRRAAIIARG